MRAAIAGGIGGYRFSGQLTRPGPDEVDLKGLVVLGVVGPVVTAARLASFECGLEGRARGQQAGTKVEGVGQILIAGDVGMNADPGRMIFDGGDLAQARPQPAFVTHHAAVLGHGVADTALQEPDVLAAVGRQ